MSKEHHVHARLVATHLLLTLFGAVAAFAAAHNWHYGGWWRLTVVGAVAMTAVMFLLLLHDVWEHGHEHGTQGTGHR